METEVGHICNRINNLKEDFIKYLLSFKIILKILNKKLKNKNLTNKLV